MGKIGNEESASSRGVVILISRASCSCICGGYSRNNRTVMLEKEITRKDPSEMHNEGPSTYMEASSNKHPICLCIR